MKSSVPILLLAISSLLAFAQEEPEPFPQEEPEPISQEDRKYISQEEPEPISQEDRKYISQEEPEPIAKKAEPDEVRLEERALVQLLQGRGVFDCKKESESCVGFPKCCGALQCHWENGYTPFKSGVCSVCLDRDATCQRNAQCCEPLVCHKNDLYSIDGQCGIKRPGGTNCHRDSQCQSGRCELKWYEKLATKVGVCANVTRRNLYDK